MEIIHKALLLHTEILLWLKKTKTKTHLCDWVVSWASHSFFMEHNFYL